MHPILTSNVCCAFRKSSTEGNFCLSTSDLGENVLTAPSESLYNARRGINSPFFARGSEIRGMTAL